jgi:hypothetical protein
VAILVANSNGSGQEEVVRRSQQKLINTWSLQVGVLLRKEEGKQWLFKKRKVSPTPFMKS